MTVPNGAYWWVSPTGDIKGIWNNVFATVKLTGWDAAGRPVYDWDHREERILENQIISPYDVKTPETMAFPGWPGGLLPDGAIVRPTALKTGKFDHLLGQWAGSDFFCFDTTGKIRWWQPMSHLNGAHGGHVVDNIVYGVAPVTCETQILAEDGLYLGRVNQPRGIPWGGKWLDNALQFRAYRGPGGAHYLLYGNFNECCVYWFRVTGMDQITRATVPVTISESRATALAQAPLPQPPAVAPPASTKIMIKRLDAPLPIDGELAKWRSAVPVPQAVLLPTSSSLGISGPGDCSATMRLAYHGTDLYVQVIRFDDILTTHQTTDKLYQQDCVEFAINSFTAGYKFNIGRTKDGQDVVLRDKFLGQPPVALLDPAHALRKIVILDNATAVEERRLIEEVYGTDLASARVMIMELKLPLDAKTYDGKDPGGQPTVAPEVKPGASFRLGLLIDDNDQPGGDVQEYLIWPSTYGTFSPPEAGALATFE